MPAPKRLPEDDNELIALAEAGLTNQEIAERYGLKAGESVRLRFLKIGYIKPTRRVHRDYIPWQVRHDHQGKHLAKCLRAYSSQQQGRQLSEKDSRMLDKWLKFVNGGNPWGLPLAVHYDYQDDEGFWMEPRRPGDKDYVSSPQWAA